MNNTERRTLRLVLEIEFDVTEFEAAFAELIAENVAAGTLPDNALDCALNGKVAAACELAHMASGESTLTKFGVRELPLLVPGASFGISLGSDTIRGRVEEVEPLT